MQRHGRRFGAIIASDVAMPFVATADATPMLCRIMLDTINNEPTILLQRPAVSFCRVQCYCMVSTLMQMQLADMSKQSKCLPHIAMSFVAIADAMPTLCRIILDAIIDKPTKKKLKCLLLCPLSLEHNFVMVSP
jgi:hypothetical protein